MTIHNYPGCCSAYVVAGFGGGDKAKMIKELQVHIKQKHKLATALTATTNISQTAGEAALKAVGFTRSRKIMKAGTEKKANTYNKIHIWYFELSTAKVKKALAVEA